MAWTEITRAHYERRELRYASDCKDEEWALIAPFMPAASKVGRPRKWPMRYFYRLRDSGMLDIINETLVMAARL